MNSKWAVILTLVLLVWGECLFAKVKIENINFEKINNNKGRLVISYQGQMTTRPELDFGKDLLQVVIPNSTIWPKIEKKIQTAPGQQDSTILGYQFNKELSRVRIIFPYDISNRERSSLISLWQNKIVLDFPLRNLDGSAVLSNKVRNNLKNKKNDDYDEHLLNELLKDERKTVVNNDLEKSFNNPLTTKKEQKVVEKEDNVTVTHSSMLEKKTNSKYGTLIYALKFGVFLIFVIGLFYGVVFLIRKGILNRSKLGFLNSSKVVEVVSNTFIAPKRSLMLVKVHDQLILLGSSENGINFLSNVDNTTAVLKHGEKQIAGNNFDTGLDQFLSTEKEIKNIKIKKPVVNEDFEKIEQPVKKKFSEQLKEKVKELRPLG